MSCTVTMGFVRSGGHSCTWATAMHTAHALCWCMLAGAGTSGGDKQAGPGISVQSGKNYEDEFEFEKLRMHQATQGKVMTKSVPWGSSYRAAPEILHGAHGVAWWATRGSNRSGLAGITVEAGHVWISRRPLLFRACCAALLQP